MQKSDFDAYFEAHPDLNLSATDRLKYYELALINFSTHPTGPYVCNVLMSLLVDAGLLPYGSLVYLSSTIITQKNFPEFYGKIKGLPLKMIEGGPGGNLTRRRFLLECIKEIQSAGQ